jgi:hypothetical protein
LGRRTAATCCAALAVAAVPFAGASAWGGAHGAGGARITVAGRVPGRSGVRPCGVARRARVLGAERAAVLSRLRAVRELRGPGDVAALARAGWDVPGHAWRVFAGAGVAFARSDQLAMAGRAPAHVPGLVFYAPERPAAARAAGPHAPAFPYRLVGWGYFGPYAWAATPAGVGPGCVTRRDWYVHERGVHVTATANFLAVPPREGFQGEADGAGPVPAGVLRRHPGTTHPRVWNLYLWLGPRGALAPAFADPFRSIPGSSQHYGSWFFQPPDPDGWTVRLRGRS